MLQSNLFFARWNKFFVLHDLKLYNASLIYTSFPHHISVNLSEIEVSNLWFLWFDVNILNKVSLFQKLTPHFR